MTNIVEKREDPPIFKRMQQHFRIKRFNNVLALIEQILATQEECSIMDAGGRSQYWDMLPPHLRQRVNITVLNYGTDLAAYEMTEHKGLRINEASGDACAMPQYSDQEFDIAHSNSVIEHVGSYVKMVCFSDEMRRVGRKLYIQTPNYGFPIDPHYAFPFIHWAPDPLKIWILSHFKVGIGLRGNFRETAEQVDSCRMLGKWAFKSLFPDAIYHRESFLFAFTKSHIAIRA